MSKGERIRYELLDLGGGLMEGVPPEHISDREMAELVNFFPLGSKLVRRDGTKRVTSTAYGENLTSLFAYKLAVGTWLLLAGARTGVAKLDGTQLVALPVSDGQTYNNVADPWHFRQYKNEVFACRKSTGRMKRITSDSVMDAGIAAPGTAPTLADGGAGTIEAGDYFGVVTFYNQETGSESDPSPVSVKLTLGANKKRTWSNIPTSTNGQVNARRLYVTLANQTGEYYFVLQINDNFTTSTTEDVTQADTGRQASFDNGLPPAATELIEVWNERIFVSDGRDVFFSNIIGGNSNPQGFGEFNIIPVYPDDGHRITVLFANGAQLMIAKTNAVHYVVRAGGAFSLATLSDRHGCIAPFSMKSTERLLFWYSGDNIYRSDGVNVASITTKKIRKSLDKIPDSMKEKAVGFVFPELSLYGLAVSQGSTTQNEKLLIYDYKDDAWATFDLPGGIAPAFVGDFYDSLGAQILYAALYDGHLYQLLSGDDDFGTNITARLRGKGLGLDRPGFLKACSYASVICTTVPATATLRIFNDGETSAALARSVTLNPPDAPREWKKYRLSTEGKLGATMQFEFEYTGKPKIELSGVVLDALVFRREGVVM